ncbi:hypothetical protein BJ944DRAFT_266657 [Cunninghamella echinulata]|nr:hypothetical protein BJ944DRAFT_266657 [Cunninghamella echinulata]
MEQMKMDFDARLSKVIHDYEKTGQIVQQLTKELKVKDEELNATKIKYEESVKENGQLYDAFKNELENIFLIANQNDVAVSNNNNENSEAQVNNKQNEEATVKQINPSSDIQLRKKLELALRERNQWHQTACQLARELQDITISLNNGQLDDSANEENIAIGRVDEGITYNSNSNNSEMNNTISRKQQQQYHNHYQQQLQQQQQQLRVDRIVSSISSPMVVTSQLNNNSYNNNKNHHQ